jgi:hypothetical protein
MASGLRSLPESRYPLVLPVRIQGSLPILLGVEAVLLHHSGYDDLVLQLGVSGWCMSFSLPLQVRLGRAVSGKDVC